MGALIGLAMIMLSLSAFAESASPWATSFQKALTRLDAEYPGQIGVFVRDWRNGEAFSFRGDEIWYIASGTKLLVALETLRQIDAGSLALDSEVVLNESDMIDGAGPLNDATPGSRHKVSYLLEEMMIQSDNTASDLLIGKVGIKKINQLGASYGFAPVTRLADVRRRIYGQLHPLALSFKNRQLIKLYKAGGDGERLALLEKMTGSERKTWPVSTLEKAYAGYYAEGVNSASLRSYSKLLAKFLSGQILKPDSTKLLFGIMKRADTGVNRLRAGLPADLKFAHKTGTQRRRACDFGIVQDSSPRNLAVLSVCTRGFATTKKAEEALQRIATALTQSGFFQTRDIAYEAR